MRTRDRFCNTLWRGVATRGLLALALAAPLPAAAAAPPQENAQPLYYRSRGYSTIFEVAGNEVTFYQVTASSLLRWVEGIIEGDLLSLMEKEGLVPFATIRTEGNTVILQTGDGTIIVLDRIAGRPQRPIAEMTADPRASFQVFWELLEENSSYFALTGFDWRGAYATYRPRVTAQTTPDQLFNILKEMVTPLRDGHFGLKAPDLGGRRFDGRPPSPSEWMLRRSTEALQALRANLDGGRLLEAVPGRMYYGTIDGAIGYLAIREFLGYSEKTDPWAEQAAFEQAVDQVLRTLAPLDALILDIRLHRGGFDNVAVALAGRLTDRTRLGHWKQGRIGAGYHDFEPPRPVSFGPAGAQFLGRPVILLTSNYTVSGAEVLTLLLKQLPNVVVVGEPTYGALSNTLPAILPNGWEFTYSNERYLSAETPPQDYELRGIPPHVPVAGSEAALDQGRDNILEAALAVLEGPTYDCTPGPTRLCLLGGRFALTVSWRLPNGQSGVGGALPVTDQSGLFHFFGPENLELLLKVVDACPFNGHFWVFYAATTDVGFTVEVLDTATGATKRYSNPAGRAAPPVQDTAAFATCP